MLRGPGSVEIVDGRSPGQHQVIVRDVFAIAQLDFVTWHVNLSHRSHVKGYIVLVPKETANRRPHIFGV